VIVAQTESVFEGREIVPEKMLKCVFWSFDLCILQIHNTSRWYISLLEVYCHIIDNYLLLLKLTFFSSQIDTPRL